MTIRNARSMTDPPVRPEFTEHAELIRRVSRLRAALEAATRDNAHLQRELGAVRAENTRLRDELDATAGHRPHEERRRMLYESCSRNP